MITKLHINNFICQHQLPNKFHHLIDEHYNPLVSWLQQQRQTGDTLLLGINGAPGTGKSTLADYLKLALTEGEDWHVAALSIDDFYLTKAERRTLGKTVHPLLMTRGVPGTHDLQLLSTCIEQLNNLDTKNILPLPQFDKAQDDRAALGTWPVVAGPIDLIILEGWCVGSAAQTSAALSKPVNQLERDRDPTGKWRQYVNRQLETGYKNLFAKLDYLFFLQAPDFNAVCRWRLEQEEKLAASSANDNSGIMDRTQLTEFMQHYERLTRAGFAALPEIADVILELDQNHDCVCRLHATHGQ
ncbi:MAG: phosphoribulokinase [Gammaproteobacteria bacterium]|jgi:D-glycerate 3-kinase|nr:phosphoribulokinase [Gammaproteobacteria bacterium]